MSIYYRATIVTGYLVTADEMAEYVNEEMYEYFYDLNFIHYADHFDREGDIVIGIETNSVDEYDVAEIKNNISVESVRQIVEAFEAILPDLPFDPDRTIKDYLMCEVR